MWCLTLKNKICICTTFNLLTDSSFDVPSEKHKKKILIKTMQFFIYIKTMLVAICPKCPPPTEGNLNESFGIRGYWRAKHKQILSSAAGHINYIPRAQRATTWLTWSSDPVARTFKVNGYFLLLLLEFSLIF